LAQTRGSFSQLNDNVERRIYIALDTYLKRLPNIWRKYTNVQDSDRATEISLGVVGFDDVPEKAEGSPYATALMRPGHQKTVSHTEFGYAFEVTKTAVEDDLTKTLAKKAMFFMFSAGYVQEKRAANLFNNGFTSETANDGLSAFNTAHILAGASGGTFRNRPSAEVDLSWNTLRDAITDLSTETKMDSGQLAMAAEDLVLLIHPSNEMLADTILMSTGKQGTADNDRNALKYRRKIDIIVNPLFTDPDAWFLLPKNKALHGCKSYERIPITIQDTRTDPRTDNMLTPVRFRMSWFWEQSQNSWGTSGA
jgi:hypothetical protein